MIVSPLADVFLESHVGKKPCTKLLGWSVPDRNIAIQMNPTQKDFSNHYAAFYRELLSVS